MLLFYQKYKCKANNLDYQDEINITDYGSIINEQKSGEHEVRPYRTGFLITDFLYSIFYILFCIASVFSR